MTYIQLLNKNCTFIYLSTASLLERFSFYGALTILIFYAQKFLGLSSNQSYELYGTYAALIFGLPVFGGLLSDKLLGIKSTIFLGLLLLIIGNVLLIFKQDYCFYLGLAFVLAGSGCYKSNAAACVGELHYQVTDHKRERAFTLFYLCMNVGATLGGIIYAIFSAKGLWHMGFFISALLLSMNTLILFSLHKHIPSICKIKINIASIIVFISLVSIIIGLIYPNFVGWGLTIFLIGIFVYCLKKSLLYSTLIKENMLMLLILYGFSMCFFIASLQVTGSINVFIANFTNPVLGGYKIPELIFSSLYPLAVIVSAPLLAYVWHLLKRKDMEPSTTGKVNLGLCFGVSAFIAFTFMVWVNQHTEHFAPALIWIVLGNLFLGAGELVIFPNLLALTSKLTPEGFRGFMMGFCYLFVAIAGYLSGFINKWYQNLLAPIPTSNSYWHFFMGLALGLAIIAFILHRLSRSLEKTIAR